MDDDNTIKIQNLKGKDYSMLHLATNQHLLDRIHDRGHQIVAHEHDEVEDKKMPMCLTHRQSLRHP
jgi:hypothetical protein